MNDREEEIMRGGSRKVSLGYQCVISPLAPPTITRIGDRMMGRLIFHFLRKGLVIIMIGAQG